MSEALGMIECKGLCALLEACDAALKSGNVTLVGWEKIGGGYVTGVFRGNVAAVKVAMEAGAQAVKAINGDLVSVHVIAQPHPELELVLPRKAIEK